MLNRASVISCAALGLILALGSAAAYDSARSAWPDHRLPVGVVLACLAIHWGLLSASPTTVMARILGRLAWTLVAAAATTASVLVILEGLLGSTAPGVLLGLCTLGAALPFLALATGLAASARRKMGLAATSESEA
jgi:hypothetical protein